MICVGRYQLVDTPSSVQKCVVVFCSPLLLKNILDEAQLVAGQKLGNLKLKEFLDSELQFMKISPDGVLSTILIFKRDIFTEP